MRRSLRSLALSLVSLSLGAGCADSGLKALGDTCDSDAECTSGLCYAQACLEPSADSDGDGLTNDIEVLLGTDPFKSDSDNDGKGDAAEIGDILAPADRDGDGLIDALESALLDDDGDCLADEEDAFTKAFSSYGDPRTAELCPTEGVCQLFASELALACPDGLSAPQCDFRSLSFYQPEETLCDGYDNDCDGLVDEGCGLVHQGLLGYWRMDGDGQDSGPYASHGQAVHTQAVADRFGQPGRALYFDGHQSRVEMPSTRHPLADSDLSYTLWVRPDYGLKAEQVMGLLSFGELDAQWRSALLADGHGCLSLHQQGGAEQPKGACAPGGHWSFLAVVHHQGRWQVYLDGQLQGEVEEAKAPVLRRTLLTLGASRQLASGTTFEPFQGSLDEVRLYGRAISADEVLTLFHEGQWQSKGRAANPAKNCEHVRDANASAPSGLYTLDVDGDGPLAPFEAWCEQDLGGGGWTLAWSYEFTQPQGFDAASNAITPRPSWPAPGADVAVATRLPSPSQTGAIPWQHWLDLGLSFYVTHPMVGGYVCEVASLQEGGSFSSGFEGPISCVSFSPDEASECGHLAPDWLFFWDLGPGLSGEDLFFYFEGSSSQNWPTHDACGQGNPPTELRAAPGFLYLRGRAY